MRGEVYEALTLRVGDALDYHVCWQPDEFDGVQLLANRAEVVCVCRQTASLR